MDQPNPYLPPPQELTQGVFLPRFNAGRITGRYLQILGCLSVVSFIVNVIFFDKFNLDLAPILLFWAANNLMRHGRTTRSWVLIICWMGLSVSFVMLVIALLFGTEQMTISFFDSEIDNPELWQVSAMTLGFGLIFGIPVWLLSSREASHEFKLKTVD